MKFTVYSKKTGEVLFSGEGQNPEVMEDEERAVALGVQKERGWIDEVGQFHPMPERPDVSFEWDWGVKQWVDKTTLEDLRSIKLAHVNKERERRIAAPIEYQGRMLDSNARAQSNISNKISEITAREAIGSVMPAEMLVWRDAENETITFESQDKMKNWLLGLLIAITERGTAAYAWSWQVKEQVNAVATREELDAIQW